MQGIHNEINPVMLSGIDRYDYFFNFPIMYYIDHIVENPKRRNVLCQLVSITIIAMDKSDKFGTRSFLLFNNFLVNFQGRFASSDNQCIENYFPLFYQMLMPGSMYYPGYI